MKRSLSGRTLKFDFSPPRIFDPSQRLQLYRCCREGVRIQQGSLYGLQPIFYLTHFLQVPSFLTIMFTVDLNQVVQWLALAEKGRKWDEESSTPMFEYRSLKGAKAYFALKLSRIFSEKAARTFKFGTMTPRA